MTLDHNLLKEYIAAGYINIQKHPCFDLWILNYSPRTQFERFWNPITLQCRGLIVDKDNKVIARGFSKFFNLEEVREDVQKRIDKKLSFQIKEKMDGSLGILYWYSGKPYISTRGSFNSDQAIKANQILQKYNLKNLDPNLTYLFEIIYPENKICVNYGNKEDLVFLSAYHNVLWDEVKPDHDFPVPEEYPVDDFDKLKKLNSLNKEGFVVRFDDGYRFKIKFEDYVRLHSLIFSISTKSIWKSLSTGFKVNIDELPDEVYDWVKAEKEKLLSSYISIENESKSIFVNLSKDNRKEFASKALSYPFFGVLFKMLDNQDYGDTIWKMVKPSYRTPKNEV